jgi:hypothetical protein
VCKSNQGDGSFDYIGDENGNGRIRINALHVHAVSLNKKKKCKNLIVHLHKGLEWAIYWSKRKRLSDIKY